MRLQSTVICLQAWRLPEEASTNASVGQSLHTRLKAGFTVKLPQTGFTSLNTQSCHTLMECISQSRAAPTHCQSLCYHCTTAIICNWHGLSTQDEPVPNDAWCAKHPTVCLWMQPQSVLHAQMGSGSPGFQIRVFCITQYQTVLAGESTD